MSSIHLLRILSSVIFEVSTLSVLLLRTVPAGNGAGVEEAVDTAESLRSNGDGLDDEAPFLSSFDVLAEGAAGLGEGFVDTDGPEGGESCIEWLAVHRADAYAYQSGRSYGSLHLLAEPESFASTFLLAGGALVPTASFHYEQQEPNRTEEHQKESHRPCDDDVEANLLHQLLS